MTILLFDHRSGYFTSLPPTAILFTLAMVLCLLRWWSTLRDYWDYRARMTKFAATLPGPDPLPLVGNALALREVDKTVQILTRIGREINAKNYGFWMGPNLKFVISDPRDLEIIFLSPKAAKKDDFYQLMRPAVTNGLINSSGPIYRAHKKIFMTAMNNHHLKQASLEQINKQARKLVKRLWTRLNHPEFNMQDFFELCIGDIVFEVFYGLPGNGQDGEVSPFFKLANEVLSASFERFMKPWLWPNFTYYLTPTARRCQQILDDVKEYIDKEIAKKRRRFQAMAADVKEDHTAVFNSIISGSDWTDDELRDEIITIYVGAHDTMVSTGCFVLMMLAMFPEVQEKAREEVMNIAGNGDITESQTTEMKYLETVIKETLRLFPVGSLIARKTTDELKLATCTVPKDCSIFILLYATHRDPKHWTHPEKFDPDEHFSPENMKNRHPYAFNPFSAGSRICPGNKFSMVCFKIIITHILRNFKLSTTQKLETFRVHAHLSSKSMDGYPISLTRIQK